MDFEVPASLACHPDTPCSALRAISVQVTRGLDGGLLLRYRLQGELSRLLVPAAQPPGPADGLWQHTCCEAFVALPGEAAYLEFNFSPSGQWAMYAFRGYRERDESALAVALRIEVRRLPDGLELDAAIPAGAFAPTAAASPLELGLSTVVEEADGTRSYWALRHPAERPDFHHRAAFALELPAGPAGQRAVS